MLKPSFSPESRSEAAKGAIVTGIELTIQLGRLAVTLAMGERLAIIAVLAVNFAALWLFWTVSVTFVQSETKVP